MIKLYIIIELVDSLIGDKVKQACEIKREYVQMLMSKNAAKKLEKEDHFKSIGDDGERLQVQASVPIRILDSKKLKPDPHYEF